MTETVPISGSQSLLKVTVFPQWEQESKTWHSAAERLPETGPFPSVRKRGRFRPTRSSTLKRRRKTHLEKVVIGVGILFQVAEGQGEDEKEKQKEKQFPPTPIFHKTDRFLEQRGHQGNEGRYDSVKLLLLLEGVQNGDDIGEGREVGEGERRGEGVDLKEVLEEGL